MKKITIICAILVCISIVLRAVEVRSSVDRTSISINDVVTYTIEVSGAGIQQVQAPRFSGSTFDNLGMSESSSSSFSSVNGKVRSETKRAFIFMLKPIRTGKLTIPATTLTIKGQRYITRPITVQVTKGTTTRTSSYSVNISNENQGKALFLATEVNRTHVYKGETIIVDYRLYSQYEIAQIGFKEEPVFNGFWKKELYSAKELDLKEVRIKGKKYNSILLRTVALSPNTTGKIRIPGIKIVTEVVKPAASLFDFDSSQEVTVQGNPINIQVDDVPANRPADFMGAVGQYTISSKISDQKLDIGGSFTYTITIKGNGNTEQIPSPTLPEINNVRIMDPEIHTDVTATKSGIEGTKEIKYLGICQEEGRYTIPSVSFSYFDPIQRRFITKQTQSLTVDVREGYQKASNEGLAQSEVKAEGYDIGFIVTNPSVKKYSVLMSQFWFWLIGLLLLLTIPLHLLYAKEQDKLTFDTEYLRNRKADKILKYYLKEASAAARIHSKEFYSAAQNGLKNYIADKLNIPRGSTTEELFEELANKNVESPIVEEIHTFLEKCNHILYTPNGFEVDEVKVDYLTLKHLIERITKSITIG